MHAQLTSHTMARIFKLCPNIMRQEYDSNTIFLPSQMALISHIGSYITYSKYFFFVSVEKEITDPSL